MMTGRRVGLVLNFGRPTMKEGIERMIDETHDEYRARLARMDPQALRRVLREQDGLADAEIASWVPKDDGCPERSETPNPLSVPS